MITMKKNTDFTNVLEFYKGRRVLITGNTGFKGTWLTYILLTNGAKVTGYSILPPTEPSLFYLCGVDRLDGFNQVYGDVRDLNCLMNTFESFQPEIVFHLAAQPIVRDSYKDPVYTYSTNVMGTVNICEAVRRTPSVKSFLNVTTDKVYRNNEWEYGYREVDVLDGQDPYSNSKSCSELVTRSYRDSFFKNGGTSVSTARAGNVIGGGDFSNDRIIPDSVRAISLDGVIKVRNPYSTRPYQHVLEPIFAYLTIAYRQYDDTSFMGSYNVGPDDIDCVTTGELVTLFCDMWNSVYDEKKLSWTTVSENNAPHESNFLKLDCSKLKRTFDWQSRWHIYEAVKETVNWTKVWLDSGDATAISREMDREIAEYIGSL